jgi:hypothetical protein
LRLSKSGMNRFILRGLIFISLLAPFAVACTEGSCFDETESYLKATMYSNETKKAVAPDSFSLVGVGKDSIIYDNKSGVKVALFPLNSSAENSKFIITINKIADTIEFFYTSNPHLISKECGYTYYHHLDLEPKYTQHNIDTVYVGDKTITNLNVENIRIFY